MSRPCRAWIDLEALRQNYRHACQLAPHGRAMAVVKANAYGHGAVPCAQALSSLSPAFAVSCLEEALELRQAGIRQPFLLLEGCFDADEISEANHQQCWIQLHNEQQLEALERAGLHHPQVVWIKVDTGMHRLGFGLDTIDQVIERVNKLRMLADKPVLSTHFSSADLLESPQTERQCERFFALAAAQTYPCSLANSAGIIAWPQSHAQWQRPGYMLYGQTPLNQPHSNAQALQPVMRFCIQIIAKRQVLRGESVGYAETWHAERDSIIATLAVGYGDGYPRHAINGTPVHTTLGRAPLAGRVSMDMITIDITELPELEVGAEVELWGPNLHVNEVASYCGGSGYELLTRMPQRVPRITQ